MSPLPGLQPFTQLQGFRVQCVLTDGIVLPRLQYGFTSSRYALLVVILVAVLHDRLSVVVMVSYFGFSHPHHHLSSFGIMSDIFNIL